jgi:hypothetical protein
MKKILLITLVVLTAVNVWARGLSELREIYEASSQKIEKQAEADRKAVGQKYLSTLGRMKDTCKREGDVQGVISLNDEIDRFKLDKTILTTGAVHVVKAQKYALPLVDKVEIQRNKKLLNLIAGYQKVLDAEKKKLTMADKLDEALEVAAELKKIEFVEAELSTRIPKVQVVRQPEKAPVKKLTLSLKSFKELTDEHMVGEYTWIENGKEVGSGMVLYEDHGIKNTTGKKIKEYRWTLKNNGLVLKWFQGALVLDKFVKEGTYEGKTKDGKTIQIVKK